MSTNERRCKECSNIFKPKQPFHWYCYDCAAKRYGWGSQSNSQPTPNGGVSMAVNITSELAVYLPQLIRLCHPDRHQDSKAATEATQWLLAKQRQLRTLQK